MVVRPPSCGNISPPRSTTILVVSAISATYTLRNIPGFVTDQSWPSWLITAHESLTSANNSSDPRLAEFLKGVTKGIEYFHSHIEEGIEYIAANLGYTAQDARDWLKTVEHVKDASKVDRSVIEHTVNILQKAGVVKGKPSIDSLVVKEAL
jgi:ABC-type nitrate/sulfonate/bicarbonate transport system substrate-binding protein